jgi:aspartate kinase
VADGGILVDMIVQNITGPTVAELSFTVPKKDSAKAQKLVQAELAKLGKVGSVDAKTSIAVVYVLGVGMRTHTGVARTMFGALAARQINIELINTSEVCIGVVIEAARSTEAEKALKEAFRLG